MPWPVFFDKLFTTPRQRGGHEEPTGMSPEKRIYQVLIVSASAKFNDTLSALILEPGYGPVRAAADLSSAKRLCAEQSFDFVIVNSPLPDDAGIRFAIDTCRAGSSAVLLLVPSDIHEEIRDRVSEHGVFTLPKPVAKSTVLLALGWMAAVRERLRRNEKHTISVEEKMEEIRVVNRAKWLLIRELGMEESEAHRYIEKLAMDRSLTRKKIAEQIIKTYS